MSLLLILLIASNTLLAWAIGYWLSQNAHWLRLVQEPTNRSSHIQPTPSGGGLGMVMAATLTGSIISFVHDWKLGWAILGLGSILAAIGFRDDTHLLSARIRFSTQIIIAIGLFYFLGNMPWPSFLSPLGFKVGWVLSVLLLLATLWWINLFNFMDGIDGIASAEASFLLLFAGIITAMVHPEAMGDPVWGLMLSVAAAIFGFLILNWAPARIFMGDVGSTWLAFMVVALALVSIQKGWLSYAAWLVLGGVFTTDATITLLVRLVRGERWYEAHRSHAYQRLSRRWQGDRKAGHRAVCWLVCAINLLWLAPWALVCMRWPQWTLIWICLAYAPLIVAVLWLGAGKPDHR